MAEKLRAEADKRRELRDQELRELADRIEALTVTFPVFVTSTSR